MRRTQRNKAAAALALLVMLTGCGSGNSNDTPCTSGSGGVGAEGGSAGTSGTSGTSSGGAGGTSSGGAGGSAGSSGSTSCAPVELASGLKYIGAHVALNSTHVFFAQRGSVKGTVDLFRLTKAGGTPELIFAGAHLYFIEQGFIGFEVDEDSVYWVDAAHAESGNPVPASIRKVPVTGGSATTLLVTNQGSVNGIYGPLLDDKNVYFAATNGAGASPAPSVERVGKDGSNPKVLWKASSNGSSVWGIFTLDTTGVYWGHFGATGTVLARTSLDGTSTVDFPKVVGLRGLAAVKNNVAFYLLGALDSAALPNGDPVALAYGGVGAGLAVDGSQVYWLEQYFKPLADKPEAGSIKVMEAAGGTPSQIVLGEGIKTPAGFTLDETSTYYMTTGSPVDTPTDASIMKTCR